MAMGDERSQWQLLNNLLANACKYSDPAEPVSVHARGDGDHILVSVKDRGVGIPPEDQQRIFEKFSRGSHGNTSVKTAGSGLGLYICKRLAEAEGGEIWVESTPGEGATFRYTVPVAGGT